MFEEHGTLKGVIMKANEHSGWPTVWSCAAGTAPSAGEISRNGILTGCGSIIQRWYQASGGLQPQTMRRPLSAQGSHWRSDRAGLCQKPYATGREHRHLKRRIQTPSRTIKKLQGESYQLQSVTNSFSATALRNLSVL
jgi:hypothetical protein